MRRRDALRLLGLGGLGGMLDPVQLARTLASLRAIDLDEPPFQLEVPEHPAMPAIHRAMLGIEASIGNAPVADLADLRTRVEGAWATWLSSPANYTEIGRILPGLISEVDRATRAFHAVDELEDRRKAFRVAADLYYLIRSFCMNGQRLDLSVLAADRGVRVAEAADDPLRIAAARWNLGHALNASNELGGAMEVAIKAAEDLKAQLVDEDVRSTAIYGALHLVGAIAAVRNHDLSIARRLLHERADPAAREAGEGNVFWTVFGPTEVSVHMVSLETEAGKAAEALRLATNLDVSPMSSIMRRAYLSLELARCYDFRRDDQGVLFYLLRAEREAPEFLRYSGFARNLILSLLERAQPSYAAEARGLAMRVASNHVATPGSRQGSNTGS